MPFALPGPVVNGQLMTRAELLALYEAKGLWASGGKTMAATIYSAIIREISVKGAESRFKKTDRGLFVSNA